jgi:hypothetical protein
MGSIAGHFKERKGKKTTHPFSFEFQFKENLKNYSSSLFNVNNESKRMM